jgi:aryl-alcohol dehydrogenase-like predicted oxidoreductase
MRYKLFGGSGLRVSELFLGAMTFGEQGGVGAPPRECARILDAYADAGGNVIDTASNYRGGASEEIVGQLLQGRRDRFVLSTKYQSLGLRCRRARGYPDVPVIVMCAAPEVISEQHSRRHRAEARGDGA